jgi:hypothetical protein
MPLDPNLLGADLRDRWLPDGGRSFPGSAFAAGQRFADLVAAWFSGATAAGFPCATARARAAELGAGAALALQAGAAGAAGRDLGQAIARYLTGQLFGAGLAGPPAAAPALGGALAAVFADHAMDRARRAAAIANPIFTTALTTIVVFPPPLPAVPVT